MKKKLVVMMLSLMLTAMSVIGCGENGFSASNWCESDYAKNVPAPKTKILDKMNDDEEFVLVYVEGKREDYEDYIEECKEAGFDDTVREEKNLYSAYSESGEKVTVEYGKKSVYKEIENSFSILILPSEEDKQ